MFMIAFELIILNNSMSLEISKRLPVSVILLIAENIY
jgi:hypothetical protein